MVQMDVRSLIGKVPTWFLRPSWYKDRTIGSWRLFLRNARIVIAFGIQHITNIKINFWTIHFTYFLCMGIFGSFIFFATEKNNIPFIDCVFMVFSVLTQTGLPSWDVTKISLLGQFVLILFTLAGSAVGSSIPPLIVRRYYYRKFYRIRTGNMGPIGSLSQDDDYNSSDFYPSETAPHSAVDSTATSAPAPSAGTTSPSRETTAQQEEDELPDISDPAHYTDAIEYEALGILMWTTALYWFLANFIPFLMLGVYLSTAPSALAKLQKHDINPWWMSLFQSVSAFHNTGLTSLDDSLMQFATDWTVLIIHMFLVTAGNTLFPVYIRFLCSMRMKFARDKQPYMYLLDYPRNCTTSMFRQSETRSLVIIWWIIQLTMSFTFFFLDYSTTVFGQMRFDEKFMAAFFQGISVRSAGIIVVDLDRVNEGVLVLFLFFMYVSVYPQVITMKRTAMFEEEEAEKEEDSLIEEVPDMRLSTRRQFYMAFSKLLYRDSFWLFGAVFLVVVKEHARVATDRSFQPFYIFFDIVSAYGTCGLSVGYPGTTAGLVGQFSVFSKLVVVAVMMAGRHRGLPSNLDIAVFSKPVSKRKVKSIAEMFLDREEEEDWDLHIEHDIVNGGFKFADINDPGSEVISPPDELDAASASPTILTGVTAGDIRKRLM